MAPQHLKKGDAMKDIRSLLNNYYFSRKEYEYMAKHKGESFSYLFPDDDNSDMRQSFIDNETAFLNRLKVELDDTLKVIGGMKTESYRTLLTLRYINNLSWMEIEGLTGYSKQYLRGKMHGVALNEAINTQKEVHSL